MASFARIAIVGAGPAGAITVDALLSEKKFDTIRVFERREKAGGIWISDADEQPRLPSLSALVEQTADRPIPIPPVLPALTRQEPQVNSKEYRYSYTPVYPGMISNIDERIMSYTQEPFPVTNTHGTIDPHIPFRDAEVIREWVESLLDRKGYRQLVEYGTTVERAEKRPRQNSGSNGEEEWVLTLRKALPGGQHNYWWQESFDALIVASGHYSIPRFSEVPGLLAFEHNNPGSIEHSKIYRGPERYRNKTVITVGASVSATDIARAVAAVAKSPVYASVRTPHRKYGVIPFEHPRMTVKPTITRVSTQPGDRSVYFSDGSVVHDVDHIIFGTGYDFSLPFLPNVRIANRRILGTYQHIFKQNDPTLLFVGAVSAGFTFLVFEWQAVVVARYLAGRIPFPPVEVQKKWEKDRLARVGDGQPFFKVAPNFEEYFEALRALAGEPVPGTRGRRLPKWNPAWLDVADQTMEERISRWRSTALLAAQELVEGEAQKNREQRYGEARL